MDMTRREIIKHIDNGANFYISLFGRSEHMMMTDNGLFAVVKPKIAGQGVSFVYHIRIEHLDTSQQIEVANQIHLLGMPVWLSLLASDQTAKLILGQPRIHGQTEFGEDDEVYEAMLPEEAPSLADCSAKLLQQGPASHLSVLRVSTPEAFALWARTVNDLLSEGRPDIHPRSHYALCREGVLRCYLLYRDGEPAAVAAAADNHGIDSLEFVAVKPEFRRQGLGAAVCRQAAAEAFADGAKILTVRAANSAAAKLYQSIGFQIYNDAI